MARKSLDFEAMIAKGEANTADGFKGQTVNGSIRATGTGWNKQYNPPTAPEVAPGGPWPAGRSNRTGA